MKKVLFLIGCLSMCTGCSLFQSSTSLLKPPELPVKQQEVKQAIGKYVPAQAEWVSPIEDKQANKMIEADLDQDHTNELIVFYKLPDQTSQMEAIVLKEEKGTWKETLKLKDLGRELHKVEFMDLNNDGFKEILVGFSFSEDASDKALIVYDVSKGKPKKLMESQYSAFFSGNFSNDTKGEILLASLIPNQEHSVRLYQFDKNNVSVLDELKLDPYVYPYYHSSSGSISPSLKGVVLDAGVGAHSSTSFIIGVRKDKLMNILPDNLKQEELFRAYAVNSEDSNGDGIIEFTIQREASSESLAYADMPFINEYYQLNDQKQAELIHKYYDNASYLYRFELPQDWPAVEVEESKDGRYVKFLSKKDDSVLFDVYAIDKGQALPKGWNILYETNQFTYVTNYSAAVGKRLFQPK
ncbi:hypothetical protein FGG79_15760 [Bacillus sp. BHET2]|uniref:hypothetical protein n=1 Tax=Bacillus sp. BHET2 TaxID=2583818 RepID=UPI00110D7E5B|nr:hypothetical protein [Bacillus sp. BHET2]TMU84347.1 hypothetical protein FGG79_15760 [Bacillus sp. BHET2]